MRRILILLMMFVGCAVCLWAQGKHAITTPVIGIEGGLQQNFGDQYLGYAANPRAIQVNNLGDATLIIQSISLPNALSPFVLINPPMPVSIMAGTAREFWMVFMPTHIGSVSDTLVIQSNDPQNPSLGVRLWGIGVYVPPAEVQNIHISYLQDDVQLSWDPVSTTIFGLPLIPDRYVVLFSQEATGNHYWQLANTSELTFTHLGVLTYAPAMFYRVKAVVFYRDEDAYRLDEYIKNGKKFSEDEVNELFSSFQ